MLLLHTPNERRPARRRRMLAAGFEHTVRRAREPYRPLGPEVPVDRLAVEAEADRLLALAAILRSDRALPEEGVRAARTLLTDGCGALYGVGDLPRALTGVERALGQRGEDEEAA